MKWFLCTGILENRIEIYIAEKGLIKGSLKIFLTLLTKIE